MITEPNVKRAVAFIDGQNLFYHAKAAFGYSYPNYDPQKLSKLICLEHGWQFDAVFFYTGIPSAIDKPFWNHFWIAKMAAMGTRGVKSYTRPLRYRNQSIVLADGTTSTALVGQEKGIDVRIALDIVRFALDNIYDVAVIFSQDQDLSEAVDDVKKIARINNRWIKLTCAFPISPTIQKPRGINGTDWIPFNRVTYGNCLDLNDYRPKS